MNIGEITGSVMQGMTQNNGDYEKDGVTYCGVCGKPMNKVRFNTKGEMINIPLWCDCMKERNITRLEDRTDYEELKRISEEKAEQERRLRVSEKRRKAFDDIRLRDWTFANDDKVNEEITSVAEKYADNFNIMLARGKGLLLYGGVGTGKSYMAACIANAVIDQDYSCKYTNFGRLANSLMACEYGEKQSYLDSLQRYSLLIIDDLGSERDTEFMNEVVYSVIDARHVSQLPLIVTTNLTADELKHPKNIHSERIFSRLFEMCIPVEVKGKDRRKLKLRDSDKDIKEMLGLL